MPKKTEFTIDPEFNDLMPPQQADEVKGLETRLLAEGCRDPLVVWEEENILLDGHTRKRLCDKHEIPYEVVTVSLPDRSAAIDWIVGLAGSRRNMTEVQWSFVRGKEYLAKKKCVGKPKEGASGKAEEGEAKPEPEANGRTSEELAEKYGVSSKTIERDARVAEALDAMPAKERTAVLRGEKAIPKKELVAKSPNKPKPAKKKKAGSVKFPWGEFEKVYGRLVRGCDEIAKAHDSVRSNEHRQSLNRLDEFMKGIKAWRERLEAKQKE